MSEAGGKPPERRSFVLYADWEDAILALTDEQRGQLLRILYAFGLRGEEPGEELAPLVQIAYLYARPRMTKDRETWQDKVRAGSEGGRAGGRGASEEAAEAIQAWKDATERPATKAAAKTLERLVQIYGREEVLIAIDEAVLHGVIRLDYVQGVLRRRDEERRTVAEALELLPPGTTEEAAREALRPVMARWSLRETYVALGQIRERHGGSRWTPEDLGTGLEMELQKIKVQGQRR